jgi:hypothetical protein
VARNDEQYRTWLELLGEILQQPLGVSTRYEEQLLDLLRQSFNGACSTRNRVGPAWENQILGCWPRDYIPNEVPNEPPGGYDFSQQPLLRWYAATGQAGPQSFGRVPDALASSSLKRAWEELARPWGVNHQLSIPLQIAGGDFNSYLSPDLTVTSPTKSLLWPGCCSQF